MFSAKLAKQCLRAIRAAALELRARLKQYLAWLHTDPVPFRGGSARIRRGTILRNIIYLGIVIAAAGIGTPGLEHKRHCRFCAVGQRSQVPHLAARPRLRLAVQMEAHARH